MAGLMPIILGSGINRVAANITISSDTANYVLGTSKVTGYNAGKTDVTLTINSGVYVYSGSTGSYAFTVDTSWATGDTVTIVNNGTIVGRGGNGGTGGYYNIIPGSSGSGAGPALYVQFATSINNVNRIAGGGGGGGGGGGARVVLGKNALVGAGGGGGGGIGNSSGGAKGQDYGSAGSGGTLSSAGNGGSGGGQGGAQGASGGSGGGYGSSGSGAGNGPGGDGGGSGGAAGAAVVGNSYITWIATGTRNGSIS